MKMNKMKTKWKQNEQNKKHRQHGGEGLGVEKAFRVIY